MQAAGAGSQPPRGDATPGPTKSSMLCSGPGSQAAHSKRATRAPTGIADLFVSTALIPASSGVDHTGAQKDTEHFPRIRAETGAPYANMLFFDDEHRNIARVEPPPGRPPLLRQQAQPWSRARRPVLLPALALHAVSARQASDVLAATSCCRRAMHRSAVCAPSVGPWQRDRVRGRASSRFPRLAGCALSPCLRRRWGGWEWRRFW